MHSMTYVSMIECYWIEQPFNSIVAKDASSY